MYSFINGSRYVLTTVKVKSQRREVGSVTKFKCAWAPGDKVGAGEKWKRQDN